MREQGVEIQRLAVEAEGAHGHVAGVLQLRREVGHRGLLAEDLVGHGLGVKVLLLLLAQAQALLLCHGLDRHEACEALVGLLQKALGVVLAGAVAHGAGPVRGHAVVGAHLAEVVLILQAVGAQPVGVQVPVHHLVLEGDGGGVGGIEGADGVIVQGVDRGGLDGRGGRRRGDRGGRGGVVPVGIGDHGPEQDQHGHQTENHFFHGVVSLVVEMYEGYYSTLL